MAPSQTIGVIGPSGSGKSYYVKSRVLREKHGNAYVVGGEEQDYPPEEGFVHTDLSNVFNLRNCYVVVEDIINPTNKVVNTLRTIFHKIRRHHNLKVFFVSHQITRNNTYSFLPLYHEIVLTCDTANHTVFKKLLSEHDFCEIEEEEEIWNNFMNNSYGRLYLVINAQQKSITIQNNHGVIPQIGFEDVVKRIKTILASSFEGKRLECQMVLLEHIFAPPFGVSRDLVSYDLSVNLKGTTSGKEMKVSLVDYLATITDESNPRPDFDVFALHEYISSQVKIPKLLIKNKELVM